ncbi:hypothetical protein [Scytonema sp. HK-05]|nr:hypothetical protein [Scytonema sp. HK-05]
MTLWLSPPETLRFGGACALRLHQSPWQLETLLGCAGSQMTND